MTITADLFDQVRTNAGISTDLALSERLGVTRAMVSTWRAGLKPIPDERIAQLCAIGKLDGPEWMARIHAEKAQSPAERALWSKMLTRLAAAAILIVPMSAFAKSETPSLSGTYDANSAGFVYYVKKGLATTCARQLTLGAPPASACLSRKHMDSQRHRHTHPG